MRFIYNLVLFLIFSISATAAIPDYPLEKITVSRQTSQNITQTKQHDGIQSVLPVIADEYQKNAPSKSAAKSSDATTDEWFHFGQATVNDNFSNYFGITNTPIEVLARVKNEYTWDFKLCNFIGADIIFTSDLYRGTITIQEQSTGIPSQYAQRGDEYYDNWTFGADTFDATPFAGTFNLPCYVNCAPSLGINLTDSDFTITFTTGQWDEFGTVTPNEQMLSTLPNYDVDIEDKAYDVSIIRLTDNITVYMLHELFGSDIPLISYADTRHSVIVNTPTSSLTNWGDGYYEYFCVRSYFVGTPIDGHMSTPLIIAVTRDSGYNFSSAMFYLDFASDTLPEFSVNQPSGYTILDGSPFKICVSHSDNVTKAFVTMQYVTYTPNQAYNYETLFEYHLVDINDDNTIEIELNKGRGAYNIVVYGCYENTAFRTDSTPLIVIGIGDDGHTWTSVGKGLFQPTTYASAWENYASPWLEVEIEKADDSDNLYRMVNPFECEEITEAFGANNYDFDIYIYFGENNDYSIIQPTGINNGYQTVYPIEDDNVTTGIYSLNIGTVSLPGAENYRMSFSSENTANVTPLVKAVRYAIVPAETGAAYNYGTDAQTWFESGLVRYNVAIPDADCNVTFERDASDGNVNLLVAATMDDKGIHEYYSLLSSNANGWTHVSSADLLTFVKRFTEDELSDYPTDIYVNPFNRSLVQISSPMKRLDGKLKSDFYLSDADNSHIFLYSSDAGIVYASDATGYILYEGRNTGLKCIFDNSDNRYPEEFIDIYSSYRFETQANVLYRSGLSEDLMFEFDSNGNLTPFTLPLRYGSLLVFPTMSGDLYSTFDPMNYNESPVIIYAPERFDADHSITFDDEGYKFISGSDIASIRLYLTTEGEAHTEIDKVIADETIGEPIVLNNGSTYCITDTPGVYKFTAVAYDADGYIANAIAGEADIKDIPSGINDINADAADTPATYYNMQGIRIDRPQRGSIVIKSQGGNTSKVLIN